MKLVTVVIKPFKLEDVREALSSIGIQGLTVTEVKGFGRQKGHAELYRGAEYSVNFLPKVKIDVAIADDQLDEVIDVISKAAYTGKIGDGKIFVAELQRVIRILDAVLLGVVGGVVAVCRPVPGAYFAWAHHPPVRDGHADYSVHLYPAVAVDLRQQRAA
jgi:nitrogen regulatory protein P-II 2